MLPPSEQACSSSTDDTNLTAAAVEKLNRIAEQEEGREGESLEETTKVVQEKEAVEGAGENGEESGEEIKCGEEKLGEQGGGGGDDDNGKKESGGEGSQNGGIEGVDKEIVKVGEEAVEKCEKEGEIQQLVKMEGVEEVTSKLADGEPAGVKSEDDCGGKAGDEEANKKGDDADLLNLGMELTRQGSDDGIVRASFKDFVDDQQQLQGVASGGIDDFGEGAEEDQGVLMMGNPELQKIREEQVRKWLIFEQENPLGGVEGSLTASMEVDSLAAAPSGGLTEGANTGQLLNGGDGGMEDDCQSGEYDHDEGDDEEGRDDDDDDDGGMPRRVRFLTDQEGNLLISVFMSNTPPAITPLSEDPSLVSNGGVVDGDTDNSNPSLVVSPPSLENIERVEPKLVDEEEELIDSIEPSAPPLEEEKEEERPQAEEENDNNDDDDDEEDEEEPPSIVLIAPSHPLKEPPREKPPAPPGGNSGDDSANDSSDETLSVSSCNSMIEILPGNNEPPRMVALKFDKVEEKKIEIVGEELKCSSKKQEESNSLATGKIENAEAEDRVTPCFQLGVIPETAPPPQPEVVSSGEELETTGDSSSESPQPSSLIIHELEEHNEGMADRNILGGVLSPPVIKLPNIDENNNVVEDSILEEDEDDDDNDVYEEAMESMNNGNSSNGKTSIPPQFNPEIGEQVLMPELRRSTSSSSGEVDEELSPPNHHPPQGKREDANVNNQEQPQQQQQQQQQKQQRKPQQLLMPPFPSSPGDDDESQMVSLCIQEEHISAVAVTIAKWESMMSKAQSTENLTNAGIIPASSPIIPHAPVTKSASSPCPKTSSGGLLHPSSPNPPPKPAMKPVQPVAPTSSSSLQVNRVVIHGTNSPVSNEPLVVGKVAGWSCWGNKVINASKDCPSMGAAPNSIQSNGGTSTTDNHGGNNSSSSSNDNEIIYAQPNPQAGSTMTSIHNPSAILKSYPKPLSKGEIMNWLREGEIHRAGLLLNYAQSHHHAPVSGHPVLVSWFFGLISRQQAERYLSGQPSGTFLVRISTRIWGYTLSYQAANGRTKHFLISAINPAVPATQEIGPPDAALPPVSSKQQRMSPFLPQGRYAFIGTNMTPYGTLVSLIRHHSHAPITKLGGEKLINPCPGGPQVAGLETLFQKSAASSPGAPPAAAPSSSSSLCMMSSA